jgi:putative hydrolase of the HAD superfamily
MKAILFDLDDTLFSTTEFAKKARANAIDAMIEVGINATHEEVADELREVIREFGSNYAAHFNKLLHRLPPHQQKDVNHAVVIAAGVCAYHDTKFEHLKAFDDVKPFLEALKEARLRPVVITHGWTTKQAEKLVRLGLIPLIEPRDVYITDQVGIAKPNPKLYQFVLRELGLLPSETLYVGDNAAHDITPPRTIGMHTAWIKRAAKPNQDIDTAAPEFIINDFRELAAILRDRFGCPIKDF